MIILLRLTIILDCIIYKLYLRINTKSVNKIIKKKIVSKVTSQKINSQVYYSNTTNNLKYN